MSTHHPRDDDRDFAQLTGAFDRPVAPSPAFAERLRRQMTAVAPEPDRPEMRGVQPMAPGRKEPAPSTPIARPTQPRRIGVRFLEIAAAVMLVSTLALSAFFVYTLRDDGSRDRSNLAALASPEATTFEPYDQAEALSQVNGPAWFFPDPALETTEFSVSTLVDDQRYAARSMQVAGTYLVQVGEFREGDYGDPIHPLLWVTDITTRTVLWESREHFMWNVAISNGMIYAVQIAPNGDSAISKLIAMSLRTGERVFSETVLPAVIAGEGIGPIVADGVVYIADSHGTTIAVDALTGEELWRTEGEEGTPPSPEYPDSTGGSLVAGSGAVYVVTGTKSIRKLASSDGSILQELDVRSAFDGDISEVTLYRSGSHLVARISGYPATGSNGGAVQMIPEAITSIDPESGEIRWVEAFPEISGFIAVTPDAVVVPVRQTPSDRVALYVINAMDGAMQTMPRVTKARDVTVTATGSDGRTLILLDSNRMLHVLRIGDEQRTGMAFEADISSVHGSGRVPPTVVTDGKAYIANEAGRILVLTPND